MKKSVSQCVTIISGSRMEYQEIGYQEIKSDFMLSEMYGQLLDLQYGFQLRIVELIDNQNVSSQSLQGYRKIFSKIKIDKQTAQTYSITAIANNFIP